MENRVKTLRVKKGFTQRKLAEMAGTSQQQIHRIETGYQSVRFDLGIKICSALGAEMEKVFPRSKNALTKWRKKDSNIEEIYNDEDLKKDMKDVGIDMDPHIWIFKYLLRGGIEGQVIISGIEKDRLYKCVQIHDPYTPFIIFDTESKRMALNSKHLLFCHFLFEAPCVNMDIKEKDSRKLKVFLSTDKDPRCFGIEADEKDDQSEGQFRGLIEDLEREVDDDDVFGFMDEDGEMAFFRAMDVALIEIPLWVIEPESMEED